MRWRKGGSARRGRIRMVRSRKRVEMKRVEKGRRKVEERGSMEGGS